MCKLKGGMEKGGHYDVEMKEYMQRGALSGANKKGGWIMGGIMMLK